MVGKIEQDSFLVLGFDGAIDLPQLPHADQHPYIRVEMMHGFDVVQPSPIFVNDPRSFGFGKPAVNEPAESIDQSLVNQWEIHIQLGAKKIAVTKMLPQPRKGLAEGRTVTNAVDVGVVP